MCGLNKALSPISKDFLRSVCLKLLLTEILFLAFYKMLSMFFLFSFSSEYIPRFFRQEAFLLKNIFGREELLFGQVY